MADGISGREEQVRERIIRRIDGHCEWKVDARGNLLCHKKGKNPAAKKVMITAHMDEAGFMLTGIRPDGLLSFANVGDLDSRVVGAHRRQNHRRHRHQADPPADQGRAGPPGSVRQALYRHRRLHPRERAAGGYAGRTDYLCGRGGSGLRQRLSDRQGDGEPRPVRAAGRAIAPGVGV